MKFGLDSFQALDRIEHCALEINRVDFTDGGQVLFRKIEDFVRRHALRYVQLSERVWRECSYTCFGKMRDDQVIQARIERREQKHFWRRVNSERGDTSVQGGGKRNRQSRFEIVVETRVQNFSRRGGQD